MPEPNKTRKSYDGVVILDSISLSIESGETLSILGPSDCDGTALLNLILGTTDADGDEIWFEGHNITRVPIEGWGFNIVFQDHALFLNLNVCKNITYRPWNKPDISTGQEMQELIDLLGLGKCLAKGIDQLSDGQKRHMALARTMVMKSRVLLLDELLSALNGMIKESIKEKVREIVREFKLTAIIVTHDPEEALTLSDKMLIVNEGNIAQSGRSEEIIEQPVDNFVKNFTLNQLEMKRDNVFTLFSRKMIRNSSQRVNYTV